jgi:putative Mn2+ efflux pump MntP
MLTILIILILVFLSAQVLPVAIGVNVSNGYSKSFLLVIVLALTQLVIFWIGLRIGNTFMYLMTGFKSVVVFIGFLLIGIRMLMEVFNIRRGERTYSVISISHVALASVAQGINSFLVGVMFYFIDYNETFMLILLFSSSVIISLGGLFVKYGKLSLAFASFLYTIGGLVMLIAAIYFSFFYL